MTFLRNVTIISLLTITLLEITTRVIWWNPNVVESLFGQEIALLPRPLLNDNQQHILESWADNPERYVQFDPVLGWSIRPNAQAQVAGATYTANSIGIRSLREYELQPPAGVLRIGTFGPSFTHCDEVSDEATWQAQMEQSHSNIEVMNWGVAGYGTDQTWLRYRTQGRAYQPQVVIIGYEGYNFWRNVNVYRPFIWPTTGLPLTKPVFLSVDGQLTLRENPFADFDGFQETILTSPDRFLEQVCPYDFFCEARQYQPQPLDRLHSYRLLRTLAYQIDLSYHPPDYSYENPYARQVNISLIEAFIQQVTQDGAIPVVLIFPERLSIERHGWGQETFYEQAIPIFRDKGIMVIDLAAAFVHARNTEQFDIADIYASDGGHFNQLGNRIVSQTVLAHLCQADILTDC